MSLPACPPLHRRRWLGASAALMALALRPVPARAADPPVLSVSGRTLALRAGVNVDFDMAMLARLPHRKIRTATPWYKDAHEFSGPLLRDVLVAAAPAALTAAANTRLRCTALNDYKVEMPLDDIRNFDVIVARLLDGAPMGVREKGPLFVMYPFDEQPQLRTSIYFSRCIWQLRSVELM